MKRSQTDTRRGTGPLRIGIIASSRHPIREPFMGGMEAHTHALATALRGRGHDVRVFASEESDPALGFEPVCGASTKLRVSADAAADVSMPPDEFMSEHHAYLALMLSLAGSELDVVHNNSLHYLPVAMAASLPMPVLTTLHTPPTPWLESAITLAGESSGTHWVAVSDVTASQWGHAVTPRVIRNGIDLEAWHPGGTRRRRAVWTGRIVPEKGPHHAIRAARLAGLPCVLAGPIGDQSYFAAEVEPLLGADAVWVGHLAGERLRALVAGSAVAVATPCWEEPYGLVLAEALACGTPVAAWDRGAVRELVDDSCGRLAPAYDVPALAEAIRAAIEVDPDECRRVAEDLAGQERMVEEYERFYEELAGVS